MFDIEFKRIKPIEIIRKLSDTDNAVVFLIRATLEGKEIECLLKMLKLFYHDNEISILLQEYAFASRVIEYDKALRYIVYEIAPGKNFMYTSSGVKNQIIRSSATVLANIHHIKYNKPSRRQKNQSNIVKVAKGSKLYATLPFIKDYLEEYHETEKGDCFIHGDYHYLNMMFDDSGNVETVIDWEFCGVFFREFDLAYAVMPREDMYGCIGDIKLFLDSYGEPFNKERFLFYYYALACATFSYKKRCSDEDYIKVVSEIETIFRSGE